MSNRCQRCFLVSGEQICSYCDRRQPKNMQGDGDQGYQWKCARCRTTNPDDSNHSLLNVMSALSDKFEVVNKIQLPKLNGELAHIKHVSENIAKQNTEILRKLSDAERRSKKSAETRCLRKRNVNLPTLGQWNHKRIKASSTSSECNDHLPMMPPERAKRYRVRRQSYTFLLSKMVQALNKRLYRSNASPRMRRR